MSKKYDSRLYETRTEIGGEFAATTLEYVNLAADLILHPVVFIGQLAARDLGKSAVADGPVELGGLPVRRASIFLRPAQWSTVPNGDDWPTSWMVYSDVSSDQPDQPQLRLDEIRVTPNRLEHGAAERFESTLTDGDGQEAIDRQWWLAGASETETEEIKQMVSGKLNYRLLGALRAHRRSAAGLAVEIQRQQEQQECPIRRRLTSRQLQGIGRQIAAGLPAATIKTLSELKMVS